MMFAGPSPRVLIRAASLAGCLVLCVCARAEAQDKAPGKTERSAPAKAEKANDADTASEEQKTVEDKIPSGAAFMKELSRLSSILGSVHFLRTLCGDEKAALWREKMNEMIEAQAPNTADKEILIASFNGGYRAFESTYRKCTPAARLAVQRYQDEGAVLSREISTRYGN